MPNVKIQCTRCNAIVEHVCQTNLTEDQAKNYVRLARIQVKYADPEEG